MHLSNKYFDSSTLIHLYLTGCPLSLHFPPSASFFSSCFISQAFVFSPLSFYAISLGDTIHSNTLNTIYTSDFKIVSSLLSLPTCKTQYGQSSLHFLPELPLQV